MKTASVDIIKQTFQSIEDVVAPTMGAKGLFAVIEDDFSNPYLTDDGVTVAKEAIHQDTKFQQMAAQSMIEAAHNTERAAYDGTTLTVLLVAELYKCGLDLIDSGMHKQAASKLIMDEAQSAISFLDTIKQSVTSPEQVRAIANITTKMPDIGDLVMEAYKHAGPSMNVVINHDRRLTKSTVEHIDGMVLNEGFFTDSFRSICNANDHFEAEDAYCVLLNEGDVDVKHLITSIQGEYANHPIVFFVHKSFNPDTLKVLLDIFAENHASTDPNVIKIPFMFVIINDDKEEELFLDIAAKTNATVQSPILGTSAYEMKYAGVAKKIEVFLDKTIIVADGSTDAIKERVDKYNEELDENKYGVSNLRCDQVARRVSNLTTGIVRINLACSTITEFRTIRFKLDDAIGAVRCACQYGFLPGAGKALYLASRTIGCEHIASVLAKPAHQIAENAGYELDEEKIKRDNIGLDVVSNKYVDLYEEGIIDSYASIKEALSNASAIASSYLKAFIMIAHN